MKNILKTLLFIVSLFACAEVFSAEPQTMADKKVLVISSYREEIEWSTTIAKQLKDSLVKKYPKISVSLEYLNADALRSVSTATVRLRSILHSSVKSDSSDPLDVMHKLVFPKREGGPDLIVFIGDEGWLLYRIRFPQMGDWKEIPIVLTAVNDSITGGGWTPGKQVDWTNMMSSSDGEFALNFTEMSQLSGGMALGSGINVHGKDTTFTASRFNITGVAYHNLIESNLNMIKTVVPDLNEIVFVDRNYYSALYTDLILSKKIYQYMPYVKYSFLRVEDNDMDSLYSIMAKPQKGKVFVTNNFVANPAYSHMTERAVDSLFRNIISVPVFSFTQRYDNDNYIVGGINYSSDEFVVRTKRIVEKILNGESANDIPFEYVSNSTLRVNQDAAKRYDLFERINKIQNRTYYNIPPSCYEKNKKVFLYGAIILAVLIGAGLYYIYRYIYIKKQTQESLRFKRLSSELQLIYKYSHMDFAIYDENGSSVVKLIHDSPGGVSSDLLCDNIYDSVHLTDKMKEQIMARRPLSKEIVVNLPKCDGENPEDSCIAVYQLIINPLDELKPYSYIALAINSTALVNERSERNRIESLLNFSANALSIGVAYYDAKTKQGFANDSWYSNLNEIRNGDTIEPTYRNIAPRDRVMLLDYIGKMERGKAKPFRKDILVTDKYGAEHWVRQNIFQLRLSSDKDDIQVVELNINIDNQKKSETKLRIAKKQAEQINEETDEFIASISHEVRTPLNAILGFSGVLSEMEGGEGTEELISIVKKNNAIIIELINSIIDLSQLDSGEVKFTCSDVNINDLMEEVHLYAQNNLDGKPLNIICTVPDKISYTVSTDSDYLRTAIQILISNAIKFTDKGTVKFGYYKRGGHFYFFVEDTGIGIGEDKYDVIFKRFEKLDSFSQGTGLGLSLCKSIIHKLGGEIGVSSKPGKGSLFWFILPE